MQIVGWYDELLRLTGSPVVQLNRAVAIGESDGARAGLAALAPVDPGLPRHSAASAYLHEKPGDLLTAARLYADAARSAPNLAERDHLTRGADQSSAAWLSLLVDPFRKRNHNRDAGGSIPWRPLP